LLTKPNITFIEFVKGYELWVQLEEANTSKKQMQDDINDMKIQVTEFGSKAKEVAKHSSQLKDEVDRLKALLESETESRIKLERAIAASYGDTEEIVDDRSKQQLELRDVYDELSTLSLLNMRSREFYCKTQVFLSNSEIKKDSKG
jgi:hypothetical protein